jgi:hypothetical protein
MTKNLHFVSTLYVVDPNTHYEEFTDLLKSLYIENKNFGEDAVEQTKSQIEITLMNLNSALESNKFLIVLLLLYKNAMYMPFSHQCFDLNDTELMVANCKQLINTIVGINGSLSYQNVAMTNIPLLNFSVQATCDNLMLQIALEEAEKNTIKH